MAPSPVAILIGGTALPSSAARVYYRRLARVFARHCIVALPGLGRASLPITVNRVLDRLRGELASGAIDPAAPLVFVGHSQGGLVALECGLVFPQTQSIHVLSAPVSGVPIIAPPLARFICRSAGGLADSLADMIVGSAYLRDLGDRLQPETELLARTTAWAFGGDWLVPPGAAYVAGAHNYFYGSEADYATYQRAYPRRIDVRHVPQQQGRGGHGAQILNLDLRNWLAARYILQAGPLDAAA